MREQVLECISKLEEKKKMNESAYRNKVISESGLNRVYGTSDASPEFPLYDMEKNLHYKEIPIELTDEEWEALKEAYEKSKRPVRNKAGFLALIAAISIYTIGFFAGLIVLASTDSPVIGLAIVFSAFILGTILLSLSEIIKLLHK